MLTPFPIKFTRLMDQLIPRSIIWTDTYNPYEYWGVTSVTSDVKRFRKSAFWLAEDLFRDDDLIYATSESLARVAKTIIFLAHWHSVNPDPICSQLVRRLRSCDGPHKPFMPTCDQSTFDQSPTPSNRSASNRSTSNQSSTPSYQSTSNPSPMPSNQSISNQSPIPSNLLASGSRQLPNPFNQFTPNQPTSDKWPSDKWSSAGNVSTSIQSPSSSLSPLSGLWPLSSLRPVSNQSPSSNQSLPTSQPSSLSLPPNSLPPGYPLPSVYQSLPGDQPPPGCQSPPRYHSTTNQLPTEKSSTKSLSSQSSSNQSTSNKSNIPSNPAYPSRNASHWQLEGNVGNERGDAAFDEFCMTPTVSTEMIAPMQNEPPSEMLTDMNTIAVYPMAVDKVNESGDTQYEVPERVVPMETSDSLLSNPIPPLVPVVGQPITSPRPNLSSSRLLDPADQTSSNERSIGSNSVSNPGLNSRSDGASGPMPQVLLPRQSRREIDLSSARQRLRPKLNHVFGSALRPGRLGRMANFATASRHHESADLPQRLVVEVAGEARREYVGVPSRRCGFTCCTGFAN